MYDPNNPLLPPLRWFGWFLLLWLLACVALTSRAQPRPAPLLLWPPPPAARPAAALALPPRNPATAARTLAWLTVRLDVREATGRNDGPAVAAIVRAGGGAWQGLPEWCGFTQAADQLANGLLIPKNGLQGGARYWFVDPARTFFLAGVRGSVTDIAPGDLIGFAWRPSVILHHIVRAQEIVPPLRRGRPPRGMWCLGGNEGRGISAGLHRSYYAAPSLTAAARWDY